MDSIRLGYACINTELRSKVFCSRTVIMDTLKKLSPDEAVRHCQEKALQNIADLLTILRWNEQRGIRLFRITSTLFPHQGNHLLPAEYQRKRYFQGDIEFARKSLEAVGAYAHAMGHRLTAHVQPFLQLGTPNPDVLKRTLFDLAIHEKIFEILRSPDPVIIMHGGGFYQRPDHADKAAAKRETLARWIANWKRLSPNLKRWITLECDERHYGVADLLPICERWGIPFCLDLFHNSISADRVEVTTALLRRVNATWRGRRPKYHISDQDPKLQFGAHAEMVRKIPDFMLRQKNIDIMVEAKFKEQAVLALYRRHFKSSRGAHIAWRVKN